MPKRTKPIPNRRSDRDRRRSQIGVHILPKGKSEIPKHRNILLKPNELSHFLNAGAKMYEAGTPSGNATGFIYRITKKSHFYKLLSVEQRKRVDAGEELYAYNFDRRESAKSRRVTDA